MLLVIDVGNTNIVLGAMEGDRVVDHWRVTTTARTTDEFGLLLLQLLGHRGITKEQIHGVAVSCVVPSVLYAIEKAVRRYLVGKGVAVERLEARGFGEMYPLQSNDNEAGRAANRRVEFIIVERG